MFSTRSIRLFEGRKFLKPYVISKGIVVAKKQTKDKNSLTDISGVGKARAKKLKEAGFSSIQSIASAVPSDLEEAGFSASFSKKVIASAKKVVPSKKAAKNAGKRKKSVRVTKETPVVQEPIQSRNWVRFGIVASVLILVAIGVFVATGGVPGSTDASANVAVVNGVPISQAELSTQYQGLPENLRGQYTEADVLRQLVDKELILQYADEQNIVVTEADAEARIDNQTADLGISRDELRSVLAGSNVSYEEYRTAVREELILEELIERLSAQVEVTDEQVVATYESLPEAQREQPLEEVRDDIVSLLEQQAASQAFNELLTQLREESDIEYVGSFSDLEPQSEPQVMQ